MKRLWTLNLQKWSCEFMSWKIWLFIGCWFAGSLLWGQLMCHKWKNKFEHLTLNLEPRAALWLASRWSCFPPSHSPDCRGRNSFIEASSEHIQMFVWRWIWSEICSETLHVASYSEFKGESVMKNKSFSNSLKVFGPQLQQHFHFLYNLSSFSFFSSIWLWLSSL